MGAESVISRVLDSEYVSYKTGAVHRPLDLAAAFFSVASPLLDNPTMTAASTHIVLHQIGMRPLNAVVQDGHHNVLSRVASLPGSFNVHVRLAGVRVVTAVLMEEEEWDTADY